MSNNQDNHPVVGTPELQNSQKNFDKNDSSVSSIDTEQKIENQKNGMPIPIQSNESNIPTISLSNFSNSQQKIAFPQSPTSPSKQQNAAAHIRNFPPCAPVPRLNISSVSRSFQSLTLNRSPMLPMNSGNSITMLDLASVEKANSSSTMRQVLICIPWFKIHNSNSQPTQKIVNSNPISQSDIQINLSNIHSPISSVRKNNSPSQILHLNRIQNTSSQDSSTSAHLSSSENQIDDGSDSYYESSIQELLYSIFHSNTFYITKNLQKEIFVIEDDEFNNSMNSTNSPERSFSMNSNSNSPINSAHSPKQSPGPSEHLSLPSLQAIDLAYQNIQNYPHLIEQTTAESNMLMAYIEDIITEIEIARNELERLKVKNELLKSNIAHTKAETKLLVDNQTKTKQIMEIMQKKLPQQTT